jgi:hypothetical protein
MRLEKRSDLLAASAIAGGTVWVCFGLSRNLRANNEERRQRCDKAGFEDPSLVNTRHRSIIALSSLPIHANRNHC